MAARKTNTHLERAATGRPCGFIKPTGLANAEKE